MRHDQTCCECGELVMPGTERFVNRIPMLDDYETRVEQNRPYPEGEWICSECEEEHPQ